MGSRISRAMGMTTVRGTSCPHLVLGKETYLRALQEASRRQTEILPCPSAPKVQSVFSRLQKQSLFFYSRRLCGLSDQKHTVELSAMSLLMRLCRESSLSYVPIKDKTKKQQPPA